eukprot:jgi/Tetstr1/465205/TSEL_009911.t1
METAAPTADFWLCQLDFQHGDVSLLQVPLPQLVDMTNPALGVERLLCQLHPSETGKGEFSKAPTWRTLAKIAAVNTRVKRKLLEPKGPATKASATLLGWCAPHASTVRQTQDGFRAVAVAMSLHLGRLVTPRRAAACFHQPQSMDTDLQAWMYCPPTSHEGIFEPMDYLLLPVDGGGSSGSETDDHDGGLSPFF